MLRIELNVAPVTSGMKNSKWDSKVMDLTPYSLFTNNNYLYMFGHISVESVNFIVSISLHSLKVPQCCQPFKQSEATCYIYRYIEHSINF